MQIYLDYSATTPTRVEAIASMEKVLTQQWGNPSSLHEWGQRAAIVLEEARMKVSLFINALTPDSIIFTSGGTESNNLAIMGVTRLYSTPQHIIISSVEHSAITETVRMLELWGWQITRLPVDSKGRVNPEDLQAALQKNTVLISIIYGQSEVGTLQPIEELGLIARRAKILFHTDAVQVAGRLPIDVQQLPVDLLSLSSHKIYGPQGTGALYIRPSIELIPLFGGGGQEMRLCSGTQALPAIAGFGVAAELASYEISTETPRLIQLRNRLFSLLADENTLIATGDMVHRLPHHASFCLRQTHVNLTARTLVRELNLAGIGISAGAACNSGKLSPSSVLLAMGYTEESALGAIRITLGRDSTELDIDWTAFVIKQVLSRIKLVGLLSANN